MLAENLCCKADRILGSKRSVGIYIQCKLVVIRYLTYTCILNGHVHALDRGVDGIYGDHTDTGVLLILLCADIASALRYGKFHEQTCILTAAQVGNNGILIYDLDLGTELDVRCSHNALALSLNVSDDRIREIAVGTNSQTLDVQNDLRYILFNTGDGTEFMLHAIDLYRAYCSTGQ